jgi:hypothetical protein
MPPTSLLIRESRSPERRLVKKPIDCCSSRSKSCSRRSNIIPWLIEVCRKVRSTPIRPPARDAATPPRYEQSQRSYSLDRITEVVDHAFGYQGRHQSKTRRGSDTTQNDRIATPVRHEIAEDPLHERPTERRPIVAQSAAILGTTQ